LGTAGRRIGRRADSRVRRGLLFHLVSRLYERTSIIERVRGKVGDDGIERVSTQAVFDFLEVPQRSRTAEACRRLAELMRELGWSPIKARGMTQSGFRDQVRGYARDKTGESVF
jgi:hypothetical protein